LEIGKGQKDLVTGLASISRRATVRAEKGESKHKGKCKEKALYRA
jgi:hypothetical protein